MADIGNNLKSVRDEVVEAAIGCGRSPDSIRLLAVSKTFPAADVLTATRCGQLLFGENRVQEAMLKVPEVIVPGVEWHLIGHLQANKVRHAVEVFDVIQSLDSEKLALRLNRVCAELDKRIKVMIQVNVGEEAQKAGLEIEAVRPLVDCVDGLDRLALVGLMAIPPFSDNPEDSRPHFRTLARLLADLNRSRSKPLTELSMGMSADFAVAVEEGSTMVRVGTRIFGGRH